MNPIATRTLSSALGQVRIELAAPVRQGPDYACTYRIVAPRTNRQSRALGVDSFQALLLAIEKIGSELHASPEFEAGPLQWLDMDEPGFPLPMSIAHLGWARKSTN